MKDQVVAFTKATGNYREIDNREVLFSELGKLLPLLQEEVNELEEAINLQWVEGALDGYLDIMVYAHQIESLLKRIGIDTFGAGLAVAENNSLKYTSSKELAEKWLVEHEHSARYYFKECLAEICETEVDGETYYCLKNKHTGKVMKHVSFPRVQLSEFIPVEYGGTLGLGE